LLRFLIAQGFGGGGPPQTSVAEIVLVFVAIVSAAFCVWLAVRIVNRRERWAKWTAVVAVALPMAYVASFGPACWLVGDYLDADEWVIEAIPIAYDPILRLARISQNRYGSSRLDGWLAWYATLARSDGAHPIQLSNGEHQWIYRQ
jgi:hypothetical protein